MQGVDPAGWRGDPQDCNARSACDGERGPHHERPWQRRSSAGYVRDGVTVGGAACVRDATTVGHAVTRPTWRSRVCSDMKISEVLNVRVHYESRVPSRISRQFIGRARRLSSRFGGLWRQSGAQCWLGGAEHIRLILWGCPGPHGVKFLKLRTRRTLWKQRLGATSGKQYGADRAGSHQCHLHVSRVSNVSIARRTHGKHRTHHSRGAATAPDVRKVCRVQPSVQETATVQATLGGAEAGTSTGISNE